MSLPDPLQDLQLLALDAPPAYGVYDARGIDDVNIGIWLVESEDATEFTGRSIVVPGRRLIYGPHCVVVRDAQGGIVARLERPWRPIGFYCLSPALGQVAALDLVAPYVAPTDGEKIASLRSLLMPDPDAFGQALPLP